MIDVLNPAVGPSARVALELDRESALELAAAIVRAVELAPLDLFS
jgi:hypothetical protein